MRKTTGLIAAILSFTNLMSQNNFEKVIGGEDYENSITKTIRVQDGHFLTIGSTSNFLGDNSTLNTVVLKTDMDGNTDFYKMIVPPNGIFLHAKDVIHTQDNNYVILSNASSIDGLGWCVAKIGPTGTPIWQKSGIPIAPEEGFLPEALQEMPNGDLVLAGTCYDIDSLNGSYGFFAAKLDAAGNLLWQKNYVLPGYLNMSILGLKTEGSTLWACGKYESAIDDTHVLLVHMDSAGQLLSSKALPNNLELNTADHIDFFQNGDLFISGDGSNLMEGGLSKRFYLRYNRTNDSTEWCNRVIGETTDSSDASVSAVHLKNNQVVIAGNYTIYDPLEENLHSLSAIYCSSASLSGTPIDIFYHGNDGENIEINKNLTLLPTSYILSGTSQTLSPLDEHNTPVMMMYVVHNKHTETACMPHPGIYPYEVTSIGIIPAPFDVFPVETNIPFSNSMPCSMYTVTEYFDSLWCPAQPTFGIEEPASNLLNIYPNPAQHFLQIHLNEVPDVTCTYAIINVHGQVITTGMLNASETMIDISTLSNGLYVFNIQGAHLNISKRFIKK